MAAEKNRLLRQGCKWAGWAAMLLLIVALLIPPTTREGEFAAACKRNMKTIGVALQNYHEVHGHFPPAFLTDENGNPTHSWRVLILPFLGESDLHDRYRFDQPWDSPENLELLPEMPVCYRCPIHLAEHGSHGTTIYLAPLGPASALSRGGDGVAFSDISDGVSDTIVVVEDFRREVPWLAPVDIQLSEVVQQPSQDELKKFHHGEMQFVLMGDGATRPVFRSTLSPDLLRGLLTINGGENVEEFE